MPNFKVTVCGGVFDIEAKDADEAIDEAMSLADYDVEEVEDDEDDDEDEEEEDELDDEDDE